RRSHGGRAREVHAEIPVPSRVHDPRFRHRAADLKGLPKDGIARSKSTIESEGRVRSVAFVAGLLSILASGCGTAMNVTSTPFVYHPSGGLPPPKPFGGVGNDLEAIFVRPGVRVDESVFEAFMTALVTLDLPFSFAADCVTFPLVVCHVFDKDPVFRIDAAE